MNKIVVTAILFISLLVISCKPNSDDNEYPQSSPQFAKGADISWVTQMEDEGVKFYTTQGEETDCFELMKSLGINAIRLRLWVNPKDGYNSKEDVLIKAKRAKELGMDVMIDFHYSDSWADPGQQYKPKAWEGLDFESLKIAVAQHTRESLEYLKSGGISPKWIQIGNETSNGMLWEDGRSTTNMKQYAQLHNAGYNVAKSVFPNAYVMVHINNGFDKDLFIWLLDGIGKYGAKYDMVGISLYPEVSNWKQLSDQCIETVNAVISKYNKDVMICEVGMNWFDAQECKEFLSYLMEKAQNETNDRCLGLFYWEPQGFEAWSHYPKSAFDNHGRPTVAMDAFK